MDTAVTDISMLHPSHTVEDGDIPNSDILVEKLLKICVETGNFVGKIKSIKRKLVHLNLMLFLSERNNFET